MNMSIQVPNADLGTILQHSFVIFNIILNFETNLCRKKNVM